MTFLGFTDSQLLAAFVALAAAYFVYTSVMRNTGSRKWAFWWAFAVAMLPGLFVPVYLIYLAYSYFKKRR